MRNNLVMMVKAMMRRNKKSVDKNKRLMQQKSSESVSAKDSKTLAEELEDEDREGDDIAEEMAEYIMEGETAEHKRYWEHLHRQQHPRRFGMLVLTGLSTIVLTGAAYLGRDTIYASYQVDAMKEPLLKDVFSGVKDGVYPWSAATKGAEGSLDLAGGAGTSALGAAGAYGSVMPGNGMSGEQTGAGGSGSAASQSNSALAGQGGSVAALQGRSTDTDTASDGQSGGGTGANPENGQAAGGNSIPAESGSPVCPAIDYGNADTRFMAPLNTVFSHDTEGMFAPSGTFHPLGEVQEDYFSNALFIGDSRTDGLYDYGGLKGKSNFVAKESLSVFHLFEKELPYHPMNGGDQKVLLKDLLSQNSFRKIYVSLGINELGMPTTINYYNAYRQVLTQIRELQPNAVIYIEGIMHVTAKQSQKDSVFNNTNIVQRNAAIASLANGRDIFYIDMNPSVCDGDGNLKEEYSNDGVHLKASSYPIWTKFLMQHGAIGV